MTKMTIPPVAAYVMERLNGAGHASALVGGCVRDMALGQRPKDIDIASSAPPEAVAALFPKTAPTGARYGTVTVFHEGSAVEVTTFRRDGPYTGARRPERVTYVSEITEDLARRDFTINAMAVPITGALLDPFGGLSDLRAGIIRCVGAAEARFREDALRMLRAVRFCAQLGFTLEAGTEAAIRACAPLTARLSGERVRDELLKILRSSRPGAVNKGIVLGLFAPWIQGTEPAAALSALGELEAGDCRLSALCAGLMAAGRIPSAEGFLRALRFDTRTVRLCRSSAEVALAGMRADRVFLKGLLSRHGGEAVLCAAAVCRVLGTGAPAALVREILDSGECYSLGQLAVTGDDLLRLGAVPGAGVGEMLRHLLAHVMETPGDNVRAVLLRLAGAILHENEEHEPKAAKDMIQ